MKNTLRPLSDARIRDGLWAWRTRGDASVLTAAWRGLLSRPLPTGDDFAHLRATMNWLCAAQDATGNDGVAAFYDARMGHWSPAYPETTGYIIPTFYDYARLTGDDSLRRRARRMADWLLTLQLPDGAFPIGPLWPDWAPNPIVFDTGQIMQGLLRTFEETGERQFLVAAQRAGDWLGQIQDADGSWRKFTSKGFVHTYNVRVAWSLAWLADCAGDERYRATAVRNLQWTLTQQDADGWFRNAGFTPDEDPLTHTIVYTIRGLLESGLRLGDAHYVDAARRAADALRERQSADGFIRARYGAGWRSELSWSCLTGNAQAAIVWLKFYELTSDPTYAAAAREAIEYNKRTQDRHSHLAGIQGGIAGSFPAYGDYEPYRYLNWAAKFFADSLLLARRLAV